MKKSLTAIAGVAHKEFLHIWRDRRILLLILGLPPLLTFIFGHAFEVTELTNVPAIFEDRDRSPDSKKFVDYLAIKEPFRWRKVTVPMDRSPDLLREKVPAALVIPAGWGRSLNNGDPIPVEMTLDGADTTTAEQLEGSMKQILADFQMDSRQSMIDSLPDDVIELGRQLPVTVRKQFVSAMTPWPVKSTILYNPNLRFIDFIIPGIIGLILQLLTVTLTACTITREREAGTLFQLLVTSLRRSEIVVGKVLPYLAISLFLIGTTIAVAAWHFGVHFQQPLVLGLICVLFLLCSLGLGLLISAFCQTQTQAIQLAVFYFLPVFPLSGAFAPIEQLPPAIQKLSQTFPLTHFCHAFRSINLRGASISYIAADLLFLALGALVTGVGAAWLLRRVQQ